MKAANDGPRNRTRPWSPRAPRRFDECGIDADGSALATLAAEACRHVSAVISPSLCASAGLVDRAEYDDRAAVVDRAWRCGSAGREFWWIIDEPSQRRLLASVIGGAPAQSTSAMERTIVAETVARLASCENPAAVRCHEEPRGRPRGSMWHCDVALTQPATGTAILSIFTARTAAPKGGRPIDIRAVPLSVNAEFPPVRVRVGDVLCWRPGTVLGLQRSAMDLITDVRLSPTTAVSGSLGVGSGNRLVRLERFHKRRQP